MLSNAADKVLVVASSSLTTVVGCWVTSVGIVVVSSLSYICSSADGPLPPTVEDMREKLFLISLLVESKLGMVVTGCVSESNVVTVGADVAVVVDVFGVVVVVVDVVSVVIVDFVVVIVDVEAGMDVVVAVSEADCTVGRVVGDEIGELLMVKELAAVEVMKGNTMP